MLLRNCRLLAVAAVAGALGLGGAEADPAADCKSPTFMLSFLRIQACTTVLRVHPDDVEALVRRGDAYRLIAVGDEAADNDGRSIADYTEALRISPDRIDALFGRAQAYGSRKAYERAILDYDEALRRDSGFANAYFRRGVTHFHLKHYDRAIADLGEAVHLDPGLVGALHLRGDAFRLKGDYARAVAEYTEEFRRRDPHGQYLKDRAIAYLLAGDYEHAIADFDAAAQDNAPFSAFVATGLYGRGVARLRKGDAGGSADIAAALARDQHIAAKFARDGVLPPRPAVQAAAPSPPDPELITPTPLPRERERALKPGQVFRECNRCPLMIVVAPGDYLMGSPDIEPGRNESEGPQHRVIIARPLAVAKFAVTGEEWQACVEQRGCRDDADDGWGAHHAVTGPSWNDAQSYVTWLSKLTGKTYRLLSEAEYEYAARAGAETAYPWGTTIGSGQADCLVCGLASNGRGPTSVGSFPANAFGLHDMLGNVQSFVEDCWHDSYDGAPADGRAWTSGGDCGTRVVRGGSWASPAADLRAASRGIGGTSDRYPIIGLRVARTLEP
jgi:formylglycine-generating enzyme required for sulfatase activity